MKQFLEKFKISMPEYVAESYYADACAAFADKGDGIMCFEKYNIFTYMKEHLAYLRDQLCLDKDNVIYCYLLYNAIKNDDRLAIKALSRPNEALLDEKYDILPIFSLMNCLPEMIAEHKKLGIDQDITADTCNLFENQVQDFIDLNHRYGISHYVTWMLGFVKCRLFRIGRFNFERIIYKAPFDVFESKNEKNKLVVLPKGVTFHRNGQILGSIGCTDTEGSFTADIEESDLAYVGCLVENGVCKNEKITLKKSEWQRVLTQGEKAISVHIPTGGKMTDEVCERDIARCRSVIGNAYGEFKAFYCDSWLLDPQIKTILGRETNLTKFADRYTVFPTKSDGSGVFEYVYLLSSPTSPEKLPEKTSFGVAIKHHLMNGGHIYGAKGVFL